MAKLIDLIVSGKSSFANDISAKTIYSTRLYMSGAISTCNTPGTWVSGMTNAAIRYNDNAAISTSSYHPFLSMKSSGGHVVNFGGLGNTIGFYGYYNGRTANSYDWSFTVNSSTGNWSMSNSITASAFITSGGANTQVVRGDGTLQTISSLSVNYANSAGNADTVDGYHLYTRNLGVNGTNWTFASTANANATTHIYAPTTTGTNGQILKSTGGTPTWINQSDISAGSATKDSAGNTISSYYLPLSGGIMSGPIRSDSGYVILNPIGASYHTTTSTVTGCITINLPASLGNTMVSMWIDVYIYEQQKSFSVHCGGYTYSNSTWQHSPFAIVYGANHRVRLGHNGTQFVVYIGETNTVWSYPQVSVRNVTLGHLPTLANWAKTWSVSFSTSVSNVTYDTTTYAWTTKNLSKSEFAAASHRHTKLHRRDDNSDYSLQHHWTGSYWYLRGYSGDSFHAEVQVGYANSAGSVAWGNVTGKPINFKAYSGSLSSGGWKTMQGNNSSPSIAISYNNSAAAWNSGTYSATLVYGCSDTRGLLDCAYNTPIVTFGGCSYGGSNDNNPTWYMKLSGTNGTTYNLNSMPYASSAGYTSTVAVNDSNSNSTYRMVWHSGSTLYSTDGIYCNPSSDVLNAKAYTLNGSSSAGTNYITGTAGRIFFGGNFHIDSLGSNATYINYYTANNVYLVSGSSQGKVGIGTESPSQKLHVSGGIIQVNANSRYLQIGPQNSSWSHFQSDVRFYFNQSLHVDGDIYLYNTSVRMQKSNGYVYASGFYHNSYASSAYALTSDGGAAHIGSMSVNYANSAGNADTVDGYHIGDLDFRYARTGYSFISPSDNSMTGSTDLQDWITNMYNQGGYKGYSSITVGAWWWARSLDFSSPVGTIRTSGAMIIYSGDGNSNKNYKHFLVLDAYSELYGITSNAESWKYYSRFLNNRNYTDYTVTKTGGGASGTWGINITGNAGYASSAGNADTVDGLHSNRFTFVYNSTNYNNSSSLTVNQMAADGNSNSHVGMIYAGTDNPVSSSGNWVHVWSQSWSRGSISSWCSQIALGVQQGTGMWYRTTSGALAGKAWNRVLDSANYTSYVNNYYWANVKISTSSNSATYPTFANMKSTGRVYLDEWIQFSGSTGLYWPNANGAHLYANTTTSYAGLITQGSRGGYCGLQCGPGTTYMTVMSTDTHHGLFCENTGTWEFYYNRGNGGVGIRTSSITKNFNVSGQSYLSSNVWIGTTSGGEMLNVGGWVGTTGNTGWYSITHNGGLYMEDSTYIRVYNSKRIYNANTSQYAFYTSGGMTALGHMYSNSSACSWIAGQNATNAALNIGDATDTASYWPWFRQTNTSSSKWFSVGTLNNSLYFIGSATSRTANSYDYGFKMDFSNGYLYGNFSGYLSGRAAEVTVNNSDSNSTYRMVWHSGNTLYSTAGIYCNPSTDALYASAFYETSDVRLKQNIKPVLTSNNIPQIKEFDWKNTGKHSYGLIAQELESMGYSELVDTKDDGYKSVNYTAALCLIIGKLQLKIKELEDKIKLSSI